MNKICDIKDNGGSVMEVNVKVCLLWSSSCVFCHDFQLGEAVRVWPSSSAGGLPGTPVPTGRGQDPALIQGLTPPPLPLALGTTAWRLKPTS